MDLSYIKGQPLKFTTKDGRSFTAMPPLIKGGPVSLIAQDGSIQNMEMKEFTEFFSGNLPDLTGMPKKDIVELNNKPSSNTTEKPANKVVESTENVTKDTNKVVENTENIVKDADKTATKKTVANEVANAAEKTIKEEEKGGKVGKIIAAVTLGLVVVGAGVKALLSSKEPKQE